MSIAPDIRFTRLGPSEQSFDRAEVEEAFQTYWYHGCVLEDWDRWLQCFTPDAQYVDHFWGPLRGHAQIDPWINAVMKGVPEIYTVLDWYAIDNDLVIFHCQNRRDNPALGLKGEEGPAYWDFPGLSVLRYAGDGRFSQEEDYWDLSGARRTSTAYTAACERAGAYSVEARMLRRNWPEGPQFARTDDIPAPSWLKRDGITPITRPSELRALLARD